MKTHFAYFQTEFLSENGDTSRVDVDEQVNEWLGSNWNGAVSI